VRAGLAIAVLTDGDLEAGMKVIDGQYGLPALPSADFMLIWSTSGKTPAAIEFGQMILDITGTSSSVPRPSKSVRMRSRSK
jgi:hypothetical protein